MKNFVITPLILVWIVWIVWIGLLIFSPPLPDNFVYELMDFDLHFYNSYDLPVDQLSVKIRSTGRIFVADVIYDPYVNPHSSGLFSAILERNEHEEALKGFQIINVRTR